MKYAIIENGVVVNVAVAEAPLAENWIASESAAIGDTYEGGNFVRPPDPPPAVPQAVTMRQARLALLAAGKLAGVDAAIEALPEPQRTQAQIEWEFASEILRASPLVEAMGAALGLDDAVLDALFVEAAAL